VIIHGCICTIADALKSSKRHERQRPMTGPTISLCTCGRLRMAARRVSRIYDRHLAPTGLGIAQLGVLAAVRDNDGASLTAIAAVLEMERTTLTRNLRPLERQGLLRIDSGADQRARSLRVTTSGIEALERAKPLWVQAQKAIQDALGEADLAHLHGLLESTLRKVPLGQAGSAS
jgi:DNA-binding MarR family transcriptional regulator